MKIGIMGFGTVGCGAYKIAKKAPGIEVTRIFSRRLRPEYQSLLDLDNRNGIFTTNPAEIWQDRSLDLVIESMGGIEPAGEYVLNCLRAGKHVVTPNKNLISAHYDELMDTARKCGVELRFTATAGGGIPWLFNLKRTLRCDEVYEVHGIVNGTCNYILDAMHTDGADYKEVLASAQKLGYAEADPSSDVEGIDTLRKAVISANIAFGVSINESDIPCYGIDTIEKKDIDWFNEHGYTCKLLMKAKNFEGSISAYVQPALFTSKALEANVRINNNMITLVGANIGTQSFYGQGAGMLPTGESVIQDVLDIAELSNNSTKLTARRVAVDNSCELHRYYIRTEDSQDIVSRELSISEIHTLAAEYKEKGKPFFFAAIEE